MRKLAGIEFPGFTYPEQFIKIATSFDFASVNKNIVFRNYFSDPEEWLNLFKVRGERPEGLWRGVFPLITHEEKASALSSESIEQRLQKFFPKPGRYHIEYVNVYDVHQRVAATFFWSKSKDLKLSIYGLLYPVSCRGDRRVITVEVGH
jgi:3-(3-hydroxy-phenyl)propionate hydroxylase